jgi:hypothetical protein
MKYKFVFSEEPKEYKAIAEIFSKIYDSALNTVLLNISENYNLDMIASGIKKVFDKVQVFACTSEYLIFENKLHDKGILAIGLSLEFAETEIIQIKNPENFSTNKAELISIAYKTKNSDFIKHPGKFLGIYFQSTTTPKNIFHLLSEHFYPINIFGIIPSSKNFIPKIYNGDYFSDKNSALLLFKVNGSLHTYNFNNFLPDNDNKPLVVTKTDVSTNKVYELNSDSAAKIYAELVGTDFNNIDSNFLIAHPLIIKHGQNHQVKVIKNIDKSDLSLEFFEPIELGTIFRISKVLNICENTFANFSEIKNTFGNYYFIFTFDSIFRILNLRTNNLMDKYLDITNNFSCFGIATLSELLPYNNSNYTSKGIVFLQ